LFDRTALFPGLAGLTVGGLKILWDIINVKSLFIVRNAKEL
jgi:hypothetical protein